MSRELMRPACHGSAIAYNAAARECVSCPYSAECSVLAADRLAKFQAKLGIEKDRPKPVRPPRPPREVIARTEMTVAATGEIDKMPSKVAALYKRLANKGVDVAASLRAGTNPFAGATPAFLDVTCGLLLKGGFDRGMLRTCLMETLNWSYGTANSHVGQVYHLLPALGVGNEVNGRIEIGRLQ